MPAKKGSKKAAPPRRPPPKQAQQLQQPRTPSPHDDTLATPVARRLSARSKGKKALAFEDKLAIAAERAREEKEERQKEKEAAQRAQRASQIPTEDGDSGPFGPNTTGQGYGALDKGAAVAAIKKGPLGGLFGRGLGTSGLDVDAAGNITTPDANAQNFTPKGRRIVPPKPLKKIWGPSDRTQRIGISEALAAAKAREAAEVTGQPSEAVPETPRMSSALQGGDTGEGEGSESDLEVEEVMNFIEYQDVPPYFCVYAELKAKKGSIRTLKWAGQVGQGHWTGRGHFSLERLNHEVDTNVEKFGLSDSFENITIKIRSAKPKVKVLLMTIDALSETQWNKVEDALHSQWLAQPGYRQDVTLYIEANVVARVNSPSFRRPIGVVDTPNAPPAARRTRTVLLEEQAAHRNDTNRAAGDWVDALIINHRCTSSVCPNPKGSGCFVPADGQWKGQHFHLTNTMIEAWANAIAANEATVTHPSIHMFEDMKNQRGATTNQSRAPHASRLTREVFDERFDRIQDNTLKVLEFKGIQRLDSLADDYGPSRQTAHPQHSYYYPPQYPP